jgi:pyridoxamine 5'-phosphate oxidase
MSDLYKFRKEYTQQGLTRKLLHPNPVEQFRIWFDDVIKAKIEEPNAMVLATAGKDDKPLARVVLLKNFDEQGFTFFTNYQSRKGRNLEENPYASLLFPWITLERQVRIEGPVQRVPERESDMYFNERPEGSQIAAWVSAQSSEVPSREHLEELEAQFKKKYEEKPVPRPANWGGYRLMPERFEFWQGRENRLHDRFEYYLENRDWKIRRLAP